MDQNPLKTYIGVLGKSQLMSKDNILKAAAAFNELPEKERADWKNFPRALIRDGRLTRWQNRKIMEGRFKGFFLGKYKMLDLLGSGGMSAVYLAEHTVMRRQVALKILPQNMVQNESLLRRFYKESQATAALDHRNIVRAYDVDNEGNIHYMVMEFVEGDDLEVIVKKDGPLSFEDAAYAIMQSAEGLAHAHERNMIHRDIKPANLLRDVNGVIKILDLGLARLDNDNDSMIQDDSVAGTTDYISPEQALGSADIDHRADIYSLGCTLYYLLTGKPPFEGKTLAEVLIKHQTKEPEPLAKVRKGVPSDLVAICASMMEKKPDDRIQTTREVADEIGAWLLDHTSWARKQSGDSLDDDQVDYDEFALLSDESGMSDSGVSSLSGFLHSMEEGDNPSGVEEPEMQDFFSSIGEDDTVSTSNTPSSKKRTQKKKGPPRKKQSKKAGSSGSYKGRRLPKAEAIVENEPVEDSRGMDFDFDNTEEYTPDDSHQIQDFLTDLDGDVAEVSDDQIHDFLGQLGSKKNQNKKKRVPPRRR